jgi:hypothetical protein
VEKPHGKQSTERLKRWEGNIKMDLREIGYEAVNWIGPNSRCWYEHYETFRFYF